MDDLKAELQLLVAQNLKKQRFSFFQKLCLFSGTTVKYKTLQCQCSYVDIQHLYIVPAALISADLWVQKWDTATLASSALILLSSRLCQVGLHLYTSTQS